MSAAVAEAPVEDLDKLFEQDKLCEVKEEKVPCPRKADYMIRVKCGCRHAVIGICREHLEWLPRYRPQCVLCLTNVEITLL